MPPLMLIIPLMGAGLFICLQSGADVSQPSFFRKDYIMLTFAGFVILAVCFVIIGKLISLPFKLIKNVVIGLIVGSAAIWIVNLFGMGIEMNVLNALLASIVVYVISSVI